MNSSLNSDHKLRLVTYLADSASPAAAAAFPYHYGCWVAWRSGEAGSGLEAAAAALARDFGPRPPALAHSLPHPPCGTHYCCPLKNKTTIRICNSVNKVIN